MSVSCLVVNPALSFHAELTRTIKSLLNNEPQDIVIFLLCFLWKLILSLSFQHSHTALSSLCSLRTSQLGPFTESQHISTRFVEIPSCPYRTEREEDIAPEKFCRQKDSQNLGKTLSEWFDNKVTKSYLILKVSLYKGLRSSCHAERPSSWCWLLWIIQSALPVPILS